MHYRMAVIKWVQKEKAVIEDIRARVSWVPPQWRHWHSTTSSTFNYHALLPIYLIVDCKNVHQDIDIGAPWEMLSAINLNSGRHSLRSRFNIQLPYPSSYTISSNTQERPQGQRYMQHKDCQECHRPLSLTVYTPLSKFGVVGDYAVTRQQSGRQLTKTTRNREPTEQDNEIDNWGRSISWCQNGGTADHARLATSW